jgi:hypothetical protein
VGDDQRAWNAQQVTRRSQLVPGIMSAPALTLAAVVLLAGNAVNAQLVPAARAHHQLVYDAGAARTYLIGGSTRWDEGYHYFDDIWYLDGAKWTQIASLPFPRSSHRVVYHEERNSLILFGGGFAQAVRAEGIIWEWNEEVWKAIDGNVRAGTGEPEICYDHSRDRMVIFGGWDAASAFRGDTWEWLEPGLVQVDGTGPSARAGHVFTYDPVRQTCLLFGGQGADGYLADTWEWDGRSWREIDVRGPSARWFPASVTDSERDRIVVFGGRGPDALVPGRDASGNLDDTWIWDGRAWEQLPNSGPDARMGAQLSRDDAGLVLFGGRVERPEGFEDRNDLWELHGQTWRRRH